MSKVELTTASSDKNHIEHVAFKRGNVYGLVREATAQTGIYILKKDLTWKLIVPNNFTSFETLAKSDKFDYVAILRKNNRDYVEFGVFDEYSEKFGKVYDFTWTF